MISPPSGFTGMAVCGTADRLGDPELWVDEHGDALLRFALLRVGDTATAEDLVQETLLAAWRGRTAFDGACASRTWMVAILKRRIAEHFRRNGRRLRRETEAAAPSPTTADASGSRRHAPPADESLTEDEFWRIVDGCASELPEHLARAFRLRAFGERDPAAICTDEGISRKNLSVRLHRARQFLRRCLEARWFCESGSASAEAGG